MKRGRPKGQSKDKKSYGPLGDLIRNYRMQNKLGLLEVAKACKCSVQFISNIEHGRAPLPWDKAEQLARVLKIPNEELQAANLAIRADFQGFMTTNGKKRSRSKVPKSATALNGIKDAASLVALTAKDTALRDILQLYQTANPATRKKFVQNAKRALDNK